MFLSDFRSKLLYETISHLFTWLEILTQTANEELLLIHIQMFVHLTSRSYRMNEAVTALMQTLN